MNILEKTALKNLKDADTFIMWNRIDEPGENPTWESQCGKVVEIWNIDQAEYLAFSNPSQVLLGQFTTKLIAQKVLQKEYEKNQPLFWFYELPDRPMPLEKRRGRRRKVLPTQEELREIEALQNLDCFMRQNSLK